MSFFWITRSRYAIRFDPLVQNETLAAWSAPAITLQQIFRRQELLHWSRARQPVKDIREPLLRAFLPAPPMSVAFRTEELQDRQFHNHFAIGAIRDRSVFAPRLMATKLASTISTSEKHL